MNAYNRKLLYAVITRNFHAKINNKKTIIINVKTILQSAVQKSIEN